MELNETDFERLFWPWLFYKGFTQKKHGLTWFEWLPRSLMTPTQKNQNNEHELKYTYENSSPTIPPTKNDKSQHMFCK